MAGIGGFSGTIPTLWCTLRGFQRDTQRAVIQNFNLSMLAVAFALHLGLLIASGVAMLASGVPALLQRG